MCELLIPHLQPNAPTLHFADRFARADVAGVIEMFGTDGGVNIEQFSVLWERLDLGLHIDVETLGTLSKPEEPLSLEPATATTPTAESPKGEQTDEAWLAEVFSVFDVNKDGGLDKNELETLLGSVGYEVDAAYVNKTLEIFGQF